MGILTSHPPFQSKLVRELSWIIQSGPLMKTLDVDGVVADGGYFNDLYECSWPLFAEWDRRPEILETFMAQHPTRLLGKRFERFLLFFFTHHPRFEVLLHNHPLQEGAVTLGEIDFLIRDFEDDVVYHLEVACKFYLSSAHSKLPNTWMGPNSSDRLDMKLEKLKEQLGRLKDEQVRDQLVEKGLVPRVKLVPLLWMKGGFYHHFFDLACPVHPINASSRYPSGWWVRLSELSAVAHPSFRWLVLEKDAWMCPQQEPLDSDHLMQSDQLIAYLEDAFSRNNRGRLLVKMQEQPDGWAELERGFVVSNSWPEKFG